jgi:hypothetical protein
MSIPKLIKIYDLKNDHRYIEAIQKATLNTPNFGFKPNNGLFGSSEWWAAVQNGVIPAKIIEGKISNISMGCNRDFPEFEISSATETKGWPRFGDSDAYKIGKKARITYIVQERKQPLGKETHSDIILTVEIDED